MRFLGMGVIVNLLLKRKGFVVIEEVERRMEYEVVGYFIKVFLGKSEGRWEMLLRREEMNVVNEDLIGGERIWFRDKNEYGESKIVGV